jgi:hypothetical protein
MVSLVYPEYFDPDVKSGLSTGLPKGIPGRLFILAKTAHGEPVESMNGRSTYSGPYPMKHWLLKIERMMES